MGREDGTSPGTAALKNGCYYVPEWRMDSCINATGVPMFVPITQTVLLNEEVKNAPEGL